MFTKLFRSALAAALLVAGLVVAAPTAGAAPVVEGDGCAAAGGSVCEFLARGSQGVVVATSTGWAVFEKDLTGGRGREVASGSEPAAERLQLQAGLTYIVVNTGAGAVSAGSVATSSSPTS